MPLNSRAVRGPGPALRVAGLALLLGALTACGEDEIDTASTEPPEVGACRLLDAEDVALPSNDSPVVDCADRHTAETFEVQELPEELHDLDSDDPEIGAHVYETCTPAFASFLRADESAVMRTIVSWAWFAPAWLGVLGLTLIQSFAVSGYAPLTLSLLATLPLLLHHRTS